VLQEQQTQHDLGGCAGSPAGAALRATPRECLVDNLQKLPIGEHLIDLPHPRLPQRPYFLLDQAFGEGKLRTGQLDHLALNLRSRLCWSRMAV
jgi:hypothetical protein